MTTRPVVHVINRASRDDRRQRFLGWNSHHPVNWRFQAAAEPEDLADGDLPPGCDPRVAATALSHRRQWQACVDDNGARLVFEDDACLRHGAAPILTAVRQALVHADMVFLGCNADADAMIEMPDRLLAHVTFGGGPRGQAGYFDHYAQAAAAMPPPPLYRTHLCWGLLAYAVSPRGAAKLLAECFPLRPVTVELFRERKRVEGCAVDMAVNAALQRGAVAALLCFPPVVLGPNGDSDLDPRKV
ncbi:glycosyltransferase family 25 protein [Magnetospirillum sp. 64-120]|uniref:glycosyltransferase family 25 protein n=1 Tax=Magnetospirillum sp. 64-120 TaxID=1895778 RepID=UPI0025C47EAD|nr:glycosyltransferase family 25 protein [Magnetospirillum sp. 64-120]